MTQTLKSEVKPRPVIRIAGAKDAQAVAALGSKVFTDTFGYSLPAADLQTYLATAFDPSTIAEEAASPHIDLLVACDAQDHVMGFAQLTQGSTEPCIEKPEEAIELQRLYVGQEYHGSGVGRALYMDVEQRARKMGFRTIWLGVWEDNFKAQKVYERFGFERIGTHDFKTGECIQTDWIMSKSL